MAKKKILIVDDEDDIRTTMKNVLEKEGYEIKEAKKAEEAINLLDKEKFDLILVDIIMPTMSGYELYKIIKKREKGLKVAFVSVVPKEKAMILGDAGYLEKPFAVKDLIAMVKSIFGEEINKGNLKKRGGK